MVWLGRDNRGIATFRIADGTASKGGGLRSIALSSDLGASRPTQGQGQEFLVAHLGIGTVTVVFVAINSREKLESPVALPLRLKTGPASNQKPSACEDDGTTLRGQRDGNLPWPRDADRLGGIDPGPGAHFARCNAIPG